MAEEQEVRGHGVALDQSQFCCSVCLDLLKEPVTIPCGHSYCKSCIEGCWDQEDERGKYSCPQCREIFSPRPVLRKNNMLAEVVEKLKKSSTQQDSPSAAVACASPEDVACAGPGDAACAGPEDAACAGPGDVACDFCCETRRNKATMSCLTCLASYCPAHLEPHYSVPVLKKHQLVSATVPLQEKMCTKHNKLMEVYCRTDRKCICYLCIIDDHKKHTTVSVAAQRAVEEKQLTVNQNEIQTRFQEKEKELKSLVQALSNYKSCSQTAVETSDKIFDQLISSIKKKRTLAKQLIKEQEKSSVAEAEELQLQLEEEITKLKRIDAELGQLCHVDDHISFIQTFQSLSASCKSPDLPSGPALLPQRSFKAVTHCVAELRNDMESLLNDKWPRISDTVSTINVFLPPEPKTRDEFLRYCCSLTLDQNSVTNGLSISKDCRRVMNECQALYNIYSGKSSRERVSKNGQVLCREGLLDRCYWEVSLNGHTWSVAVSYKDISKPSSHNSEFGSNNESWSLECSATGVTFKHNNQSTTVSGSKCSKIGVFLDYKADTLSFYSVSGRPTLLHKEHIMFTQPVYPGFGLRDDGSNPENSFHAELIKLWK